MDRGQNAEPVIDLSLYRRLLDRDPALRARYDESVERYRQFREFFTQLLDQCGMPLDLFAKELANPLQEGKIP